MFGLLWIQHYKQRTVLKARFSSESLQQYQYVIAIILHFQLFCITFQAKNSVRSASVADAASRSYPLAMTVILQIVTYALVEIETG